MSSIRFIFADQCSHSISSLKTCDKSNDIILMCEVKQEAKNISHHKKKILFLFSIMRHFAKELKDEGYNVLYIKYDDKINQGSFTNQLKYILKKNPSYKKVILTHPGDYRVYNDALNWSNSLNCEVNILQDDRFYTTIEDFNKWFDSYKAPRMEIFYRLMRKKHNILIKNNQPTGGKWNYDIQNRKSPNKDLKIPKPFHTPIDTITKDVINLVKKEFNSHFGLIDDFHFAVTKKDAKKALEHFIKYSLKLFGKYQDSMIENEPWMFHSHIGLYLNTGLLTPQECINKVLIAYEKNECCIASCEGFIRQIIGWREYIRGIYWKFMPKYKNMNHLNSTNNLPSFFWSGDTKLNCLKNSIQDTKNNAYAHHIQRLMIIGNFATLMNLNPIEVSDWFLAVYVDAFEWVELPNVIGMALYADGGILGSKPYISSGSYINKMSTYCKNCQYNIKEKIGENACPFNYLYWTFLNEHKELFKNNPRMNMMINLLNKIDNKTLENMKKSKKDFRLSL